MQVTVTYAQSIDGRIATLSGESKWISGDRTLRLAHRLRGGHDGILVGVGTAAKDDPELTCRLLHRPSPARIVLDSKLSIPTGSLLVKTAARHATILLTTARASRRRIDLLRGSGVQIVLCESNTEGRVDLAAALGELGKRGIQKLLVEGGSGVITSFLLSGFVTRLVVVIAPLIIGEGTPAVKSLGVERLNEAKRLKTVKLRRMGEDLVWELKPDG